MQSLTIPIKISIFLFVSLMFTAPTTHAQDKRFWKKRTPSKYALYWTRKTIKIFPKFEFDQCQQELLQNPKSFVKNFDHQFRHLAKTSRVELDKLSNTAKQLKETERNNTTYENYLQWLYTTSNEFYRIGNYHGLFHFLNAIAMQTDFRVSSGNFDHSIFPGKTTDLEFLFGNFIRRLSSQTWENRCLEKNELFFPNIANIRIELEKISGENFEIEASKKKELISSICARLSAKFIHDYKTYVKENFQF